MNSQKEELQIIRAAGILRERGLEFIRKHYAESFGTVPLDTPDHVFIAYTDPRHIESTMIGTIGINIWNAETSRLARIYEFDWTTAPMPVVPELIFEYGRLIATRPGISKALIAVASSYALSIGRTCGWCEHTKAVHRICVSFGLPFHNVLSRIRYEAIADEDKEFYRRNPSVQLYMTDTNIWNNVLQDCVTYRNGIWSIQ